MDGEFGYRTLAVHGGRDDLGRLGVHAPPIDLSTTYPIADLRDAGAAFDALAEGEAEAANPIYARLLSPTCARFERALAALESAEDAVAFGSGMAALTAVLLSFPDDRRTVLGVRPLYGGTDHLLESGLLAVDVRWVEVDQIASACTPDVGLVIVESPTNPTLEEVDIAAVCAAAGGVPVLVDNTFATPVLQRPLELGAAFVLHSATKYLGGHGDALGGIVATDGERARRLRQTRILTGGVLHPLGAYLMHRGLATLPVRVRAAEACAAELARRFAADPRVDRVYYPGLAGAPRPSQMDGTGAMISIDLDGGTERAAAFMGRLEIATPAVSLGSVDTLVQHPASLTHRLVGEAGRREGEISDDLIRISVGLEDVEDLWRDFSDAL